MGGCGLGQVLSQQDLASARNRLELGDNSGTQDAPIASVSLCKDGGFRVKETEELGTVKHIPFIHYILHTKVKCFSGRKCIKET